MPTKPAKFQAKREIKKLDKFCREIVFARDGCKCVRCGKGKDVAALHWAHVQTRAAKATRWHLDNSFCLCYYCHFRWAHEYPLAFARWVEGQLGTERMEAITIKSSKSQPLTPALVTSWWQYLSDEAQKYGVRLP